MLTIEYEDLADRLTDEAQELFCEMCSAHVDAGSGDRLFIRSDTMSGTGLIFSGGDIRRDWHGFDGGAIEDLASYGLLHTGYSSRGTPNYRLSGEGQRFYRWLMGQRGAPITQAETEVQHLLAGEQFASGHPSGAHHLGEAFSLLWSGETDDKTVSEIGDHLRKAIMDITSDVAGADGGNQEKPIQRLAARLQSASGLSEREAAALTQLVELGRAVFHLDQRLNHIRDESDKGQPLRAWDEVRRAAFLTAFICYELDRLPSS